MRVRLAATASLVAFALGACSDDDSTAPGDQGHVDLELSSADVGPTPSADTISVGASTLVLTNVQLVARQVRLRKSGDTCPDSSGTGDATGCGTLILGPVLLTAPLGGSVTTLAQVAVDPGSYDRLQFQIHQPTAADDATFLQSNPGFDGVSVMVTGSYNGVDFSYTTDVAATQTLTLSAPVVVAAGATVPVALRLDVHSWFLDAGALIDPAAALITPALKAMIDANIQASFTAFQDDNRDGTPQ